MLASRLFRSGFVCVPVLVAAAWAAGCSDDDPAATPPADDGGKSDAPVVDGGGGNDASDGGGDPKCGPALDIDGLYKTLSCAGLYTDIAAKTVGPDLLPYKPSTEFWSDGAEKTRWIQLPPGTKIDTTDMNEWVFPVGTRVFKEFKIGGKRIETRLYQKFESEWKNTTYRWKADESEAERLEGGERISGLGPDGGVYEIPDTTSCGGCHNGRKDSLLGVDAVSLGLPNATGLTLASLVDKKLLTTDPPAKTLAYPTASADQGGDKAGPALAWLHINCGTSCHNAGGGQAGFTGRLFQIKSAELMPGDGGAATIDKLESYTLAVCKDSDTPEVPPTVGTMKVIRPGAPARSAAAVLSGRRTPAAPTQMPPNLTHAVDLEGHKRLTDWITALATPCP